MSDLEVRIVKLEPMRVASAYAYGSSPEIEAWNILISWAKERGLLDKPIPHRIYGFNNPSPSPGSPNYGYEFWMEVDSNEKQGGDIKLKEFGGGLYGVARCNNLSEIGNIWKKLVTWREGSKYKEAHHQWLEGHVSPDPREPLDVSKLELDLYIPIAA